MYREKHYRKSVNLNNKRALRQERRGEEEMWDQPNQTKPLALETKIQGTCRARPPPQLQLNVSGFASQRKELRGILMRGELSMI
jgi:hypothetical protein